MNVALIIAGGKGERMHQDIPKQFINVNDKPVILYTLEAFQKHPDIDAIYVSCLKGWEEILKAYAKQYSISKLEGIVPGGKVGQESIRNGIDAIATKYERSDLVIIHDAIRPLISAEIISDNIVKCREYGNAVTVIPCMEAMLKTENHLDSNEIVLRDSLFRAQTPQTVSLGEAMDIHKEALKRNITDSVATCTLLIESGRRVWFTRGSEKNIKITTLDDIEIFKALLAMQNRG